MIGEDRPTLRISIFLLIFCIYILTASETCTDDDVYVIRTNGPNNYAVDATDPNNITLEEFTGSKGQLWKFQTTDRPGAYFVINEKHGKVMDFALSDDNLLHLILTNKQEKSLQQKWNHTPRGRIVNFLNGKNLDIQLGIVFPGSRILVFENNGNVWQRWFLHKKV